METRSDRRLEVFDVGVFRIDAQEFANTIGASANLHKSASCRHPIVTFARNFATAIPARQGTCMPRILG